MTQQEKNTADIAALTVILNDITTNSENIDDATLQSPLEEASEFPITFTNLNFKGNIGQIIGLALAQLRALENVIIVNSAADFPTAVAGVVELTTSPGIKLTYLLGAVEIDMGSDRFTITGGQIVIRGIHQSATTIKSTTSGNLFTMEDAFVFFEFFVVDCANAKVIEYTNPGAVLISLIITNFVINTCDSIFDIEDAFITSLRTVTLVSATTAGILWTGTNGSQINISNFNGLSWTGTLLDLGTATFDIIEMTEGNRFISPSGTTILSGASSNGNLNSGGRGIVDANLFNGIGTAISGIDTQDTQWNFSENIFADNTTTNSKNVADAFLTASEAVTITTQSVYVAIGGTNWSSSFLARFTVSTAGIIEYIGLPTIEVKIGTSTTVSKVGGGSDQICTKIAIDTGSGFVVADKTIGCTQNSTPTGVVSLGFFSLDSGDKIQLFVGNEDSTANIDVANSTITIDEV